MLEWIMICILIGVNIYLVYRIEKLNYLLTETLNLVDGNIKLITKVQDFSFKTADRNVDIWKRHLEVMHGAIFEEGLKDKEGEPGAN